YLSKNIRSITTRNYITLNEDNRVSDGVNAMRTADVSSVIIVRKATQRPVGIITERDILYRVTGENKNPGETPLWSIMSRPLISIGDQASVIEAICMMRNRHIRRLIVRQQDGTVLGITTLRSAIGNIPSQGIDLAEVDNIKKRRCLEIKNNSR
ncbi:MAG TPA: CBS domain-containing protein, partial [Nitrososphaeraceae archaeon]|nr:CBS domain-containing protein [Nitrososphaeraceae archaeon]